jgi:hypothetical protein
MERPALNRQAVEYAVQHYGISRRRACRIVKQHRSMQYYRYRKDPKTALRARMRELAQSGCGTVIGACTFSFGGRAGSSARTRHIGSTRKSTCSCVPSGRG